MNTHTNINTNTHTNTNSNINTYFSVPSPIDLKKIVRNNDNIAKLRKDIDEITEDDKWFENRQQSFINLKVKHENDLRVLLQDIECLTNYAVKLQNKIEKAKLWMQNPKRNVERDNECLQFQHNTAETIDAIKTQYIPHIEATIKQRNYQGLFEWIDKFIRNKPGQVIQRVANDGADVVKKTESHIVDFHSVKGKEKQLLVLKNRLNNCSNNHLTNFDVGLNLEQRIANLESAIAFRKIADARKNGQVQAKLAQEYFENEQTEIQAICREEWMKYIDKMYFRGGIDAFYQ